MKRIQLIHWNAAEAEEKAGVLRAAGYEIDCRVPSGPDSLRMLRENPPDAVIIDLSRLPSQGRDYALAIRKFKATRHVPLVFVDGPIEKLEIVRQILPDAIFTTWQNWPEALIHAIAHPPINPVVPKSTMEGYSGAPLAKKLGIKANATVTLINAPEDIDEILASLPNGVRLQHHQNNPCGLTIWFARTEAELKDGIVSIITGMGESKLWIAWPKKTSPLASDIGEINVRKTGLASGLVDYKVCAIDAIWSGLLFTKRKAKV
jgi:CheY-like chemotaxis protein